MLRSDKSLLESMGADLIHRTDDRFFGDKFGRSRELKTTISKSIMKLKKLKEEFTIEEYDMLKRLIDNPQKRYDARSYVEIRKRDSYPFVHVNFVLTSNNFPKAIINKLNNVKKNINDVKEYGISVEKNGITKTVNIQISWVQDYPEEYEYVFKEHMSKEIGIEVIKYVLYTIKPIFEDILNWSKTNESADGIMLRKDKALLESLTRKYGKNEMLNNIKRYSNGRNSISNKFYYLEDKLTDIFETYDIDYFSVNQNKAIPTLIIEVNGYKYPFECVGFIFDGIDVSMDLQSGKTNERIELPLIDLDDIRTIAEISDWLKENEDAIVTSIVKDMRTTDDVYESKNNILRKELKNKVNETAGRMPTRFANPDAWFDNTSFQELEELTGYSILDFYLEYEDEREAEEEFIAVCEEWWNKHTPIQKRKIFNEYYINA